MNYCSTCHTLELLRWNRLQRDLDIPETILIEDLIADPDIKAADYMTFGLPEVSALGAPDLTLRTRVRGEDWVYTYLRTFYEDPEQLLGSNNLVYPGTSMPNVLVALQGSQALDKDGKIKTKSEGSLSKEEFDDSMKDLVNFLAYASEPARITREKNGIFVILFFIIFTAVMWLLYREYAKEMK
jgi:Cytochrome c1